MYATLIDRSPWPEQPGSRTGIGPFFGAADAHCIAELAGPERLLLVVAADTASALTLERELRFPTAR